MSGRSGHRRNVYNASDSLIAGSNARRQGARDVMWSLGIEVEQSFLGQVGGHGRLNDGKLVMFIVSLAAAAAAAANAYAKTLDSIFVSLV
jgi:hypothetical protein